MNKIIAVLAIGVAVLLATVNVHAQQKYFGTGGAATAVGTTTATATLDNQSGIVTSAALTTAAAGTYTLTLTNNRILAGSKVFASVANGTNTGGLASISSVTPAAGSVVIVVRNAHATTAFNGTIKVAFLTYD